MPRSPRCAILVACSLLAVTAAPVGHAQPLDLTFFRPIGSSSALTLESPVPARVTELELALAMDYAHALLERRVACPASASSPDPACVLGNADGRTQVVPDMLQLDLIAALALADAVRLSAALPLVLTRAADDLQAPQELRNTFGTGDLRLALTAPLLRGAWPLALAFESTFPTARDRVLAGVHGVSVTPALVAAHAFGRVTLSAKLGYRLMRRNHVLGHEQDDALVLGFGASYELLRELRAIAELRAQLGIGGRRFDAQERPMELDLGLAVPGPADTSVVLGAGAGAWPGHDGIGAPGYRLFAAISGKLALGNECASDAPCAAVGPDADRDGVPDARDTCPNDAEDRDGFADDDGCPDLDNDADGLPDARDTCPTHSEDRDGYQDTDGCPEPDNDGDGIADGRDLCRLDPEDKDGFEDGDGCPEPGPGRPTVSLEGTRILMSDRIYFDDDADTIRQVSMPVLDELAKVLLTLVKTKRVRVEGHTDDIGGNDYNTDLSYRRARAVVEYLVGRGVPADRMEYVGRGATQPLAPNDTPEGRALNRRVELIALDPK